MLSFRPEQWGSMEHDTEESSDMYGMSPGNWTKPDARETSEAEQHRKVYNNGGLGHAYDYGVGPEVVVLRGHCPLVLQLSDLKFDWVNDAIASSDISS
jgi:hypothetical protein